jgi:hypothetical protein
VVNYKKSTAFVATDEGAELRRALPLGTVTITQDHINGEHVAHLKGVPETIQRALLAILLPSV